MKDDKLRKAAEKITMPDDLKNRILDQCSEISANEKRCGIDHNTVSGVERVQSHPIRRTLTAVAACAVLAAGVGTGIHFMPKSGGSESASSTSEKELDVDESALPADISVIFNNDFVCEGSRELTEEQRNDIKYIVCGFDWTEITQEEFGNIDEADSIYYFEAVDGAYIYTLTLYDNDRAFFVRNTPEDQSEDSGAEVNGIYFRVKSAEIVEKMTEYFSSGDETEVPDGEAVPPLAGIAEREYKEIGYSSDEPLSEEQRLALDKLVSETEFRLEPNCNAVYRVPAYFFTDTNAESSLTYFYSTGVAEVREYGKTWFYQFDFDKFSKAVDEILFPDSIYSGADLVCRNMLNENVTMHAMKLCENKALSDEGRQAMYSFLSNARFRKVDDFDDIQTYICTPSCDWYSRKLGFESYDFFCEESCWSMIFYDCGKLEVIDYSSGEQEVGYYLYDDNIGLDTAVHDAFPEFSSSYPLFGSLYKMGEIKVNGEVVEERMVKNLSNAFFGYDYSNNVVNDSFRSEEPVYTIETSAMQTEAGEEYTLTIRVYKDGTLEYNDTEGKIHSFDKLGFPEPMGEPLLTFDIETALDPNFYE